MPAYHRKDVPKDFEGLLRFLQEELARIEGYAKSPLSDGQWDNLRFPATAVGGAGSGWGGGPTWDGTNIGWAFPSTATKDVQMMTQLPHCWMEGTNIRPHLHWEAGTGYTPGTAVVWVFSYRWRNEGQVAGAMTNYTMTSTPTATLALMRVVFPEIDGAGKEISSILEMQLSRTPGAAGDSMTANAIYKVFDINMLVDSFGSVKEYKK